MSGGRVALPLRPSFNGVQDERRAVALPLPLRPSFNGVQDERAGGCPR